MKIAIATQDLARIDAHLGWARHLMIYEVDAEGYCYLDMATFPTGRQDGDHSKLAPRLKAMEGCQLALVADVGPDGEFGLARTHVIPIRKFAGEPIALALEALRDGMRGQPPLWLRQAEQRYRRENIDG
ncbi:Nitrogenase FeMo-cofactor carrier protein NifX [Paramagnetospirillum magnetotacticum MS-1]|uniref:Nitrogenase FeMo-cofactor carrier protein NifX n=1 Tax=Paramagnetospirillum magnetotacticum MS-1 TaxID=272627 RepID=A0A0C2YIA4_PARME|nr:NifB/NifX family molybdenum-iron cluster-binding protein [Paramagnetospirillum magnetotacticum]KIL99474.1 Nitrogenase FeMo-cofactor carrier protein NifX [Paramagnetospirillum magnetotacticum MS-1]